MKIHIAIVVVCSWLMANSLFAEPTMEALRWSQGEFEIPAEIQQIIDANELQPFLNSRSTLLRISAIRRLGEIEGPNAIGTLLDIFEKEPPIRGIDRVVIVRSEIVRTLGRMDSDTAKTALLDILERFWKAGPQVPEERKGYWYEDVDFTALVPESLKYLYKWSNDEKVYETAKTIALSEDVKKYVHRIGHAAWKVYLKGEMAKKRITERESVMYLLRFYEDIIKKGVASESLEASKIKAASEVLMDCNEVVLTNMYEELENAYKSAIIKNDPNANRIGQDARYIENILKAKEAKKAESKP
jgi:hypothetical protein